MWIFKDQYNQLRRQGEFWRDEYHALEKRKQASIQNLTDCLTDSQIMIDDLMDRIKLLESENEELKEYKQKYADEVQKRLELVKLLENTP